MEETRFPDLTEKLRKLRPADMSQEQFAKHLGISRAALSNYESGKRIPDALMLKTIAQKCDFSADLLLGISHEKMTDKERQILASEYTGISVEAIETLHTYAHLQGHDEEYLFVENFSRFIVQCYPKLLIRLAELKQWTDIAEERTSFIDLVNDKTDPKRIDALATLLTESIDELEIRIFKFSEFCRQIPELLFNSGAVHDRLEDKAIEKQLIYHEAVKEDDLISGLF